jgi:hypothetical protein
MKPMQSLLRVFARKQPGHVFTARVGTKTIKAVEQEFVFTSRDGMRNVADQVQIEHASVKRLGPGGKSLHFINVKEASEKFRLAARTIQQLCHDGKVVCQKQGQGENSRWLVAEESLRAYCKAQGA